MSIVDFDVTTNGEIQRILQIGFIKSAHTYILLPMAATPTSVRDVGASAAIAHAPV